MPKSKKSATPVSAQKLGNAGSTYAVIVGISDYQSDSIPDLRYAHRDAEAFADFLRGPSGGNIPTEQIRILLNREGTTAQFAQALGWLMEKCKPEDRAVIFFPGTETWKRKPCFRKGF